MYYKLLLRISNPAHLWLRKETVCLGISVSELVRRIIDENGGPAMKRLNISSNKIPRTYYVEHRDHILALGRGWGRFYSRFAPS